MQMKTRIKLELSRAHTPRADLQQMYIAGAGAISMLELSNWSRSRPLPIVICCSCAHEQTWKARGQLCLGVVDRRGKHKSRYF